MSYGFRQAIKRRPNLWNKLTEEEKKEIEQWCPLSDMLVRDKHPGENVDSVIARMSERALEELFNAVMARHRRRKKKERGELTEEEEKQDYDVEEKEVVTVSE